MDIAEVFGKPVEGVWVRALSELSEGEVMEEEWATDIGTTSFIIKYDDGRKVSREFYLPGSSFADLFRILRQMVPESKIYQRY